MGDSKPPGEFTFKDSTQVNAPRIPDELWEKHKAVIVEYYESNTLQLVMVYMKEKYNFAPTKRQYIHRFAKWEVKKYNTNGGVVKKKDDTTVGRPNRPKTSRVSSTPGPNKYSATPAPSSETSQLNQPQARHLGPGQSKLSRTITPVSNQPPASFGTLLEGSSARPIHEEDTEAYRLDVKAMTSQQVSFWYNDTVADFLSALGDHESSFQIRAPLYRDHQELPLALACARTAQTPRQFQEVHAIIEDAINKFPSPENSWGKFIFNAQVANYWDQIGDNVNGPELFSILVERYINIWTSQFYRPLTPRLPKLDLTAYENLYRTVRCFNNDSVGFDIPQEDDPKLDVDLILEQFLAQQPAFANGSLQHSDTNHLLSEISSLKACLKWCVDVLKWGPTLPAQIQNVTGHPVHKISCMLWCVWIRSQTTGQGSDVPSPSLWSDQCKLQLDKSPSELLTIVVTMIMAARPRRPQTNQHQSPSTAVVSDALNRALALDSWNSNDLLTRFLYQVRETSEQRMVPNRERFLKYSEFAPFRNLIAEWVPIQLPAISEGAVIHPLILADGAGEDAISFQHGAVAGYHAPSGLLSPQSTYMLSQPVDPNLF